MCKRIITVLFLCISLLTFADNNISFQKADSITNSYYLAGDWEQLIVSSKEILNQGIDFKTLRQRLGYAYFMQAKYYKSQKQYEEAYNFDKSDAITLQYLYFNGLNNGDQAYARYYASKLPEKTQEFLGIKKTRILDAFDLEYNQKTAYDGIRSAPEFIRMGVNTQIGYRLNLYQTVSNYKQTINIDSIDYAIVQNEYFGLLNYSVNSKFNLMFGYHHLNSKVNTDVYKGNIFLGKMTYKLGRFDLGLVGSNFNMASNKTYQYGFQGGVSVPGKARLYLKSSIYNISDSISNNWVFSQSAGFLFAKRFWLDGNITLGNQKNFVDLNGLYVYNSFDPTIFKTGLSLFWYATNNISLYTNYTFNKKYIVDNDINYFQHSYTGGLIWKL